MAARFRGTPSSGCSAAQTQRASCRLLVSSSCATEGKRSTQNGRVAFSLREAKLASPWSGEICKPAMEKVINRLKEAAIPRRHLRERSSRDGLPGGTSQRHRGQESPALSGPPPTTTTTTAPGPSRAPHKHSASCPTTPLLSRIDTAGALTGHPASSRGVHKGENPVTTGHSRKGGVLLCQDGPGRPGSGPTCP